MKKNSIKTQEFDKKFDDGEDITVFLDTKNIKRPGLESKRVSVDFPEWMVIELDKVSKKLGVTRQSIIKLFISDKLDEEKAKQAS